MLASHGSPSTGTSPVPVFHVANSIIQACEPYPVSAQQLQLGMYLLAEHIYVTQRYWPYHATFLAAAPGPIIQDIALYLLAKPKTHLKYLSLDGQARFTTRYAHEIARVAAVCTYVPVKTIHQAVCAPGLPWDMGRHMDGGKMKLELFDDQSVSTLAKLLPQLKKLRNEN